MVTPPLQPVDISHDGIIAWMLAFASMTEEIGGKGECGGYLRVAMSSALSGIISMAGDALGSVWAHNSNSFIEYSGR